MLYPAINLLNNKTLALLLDSGLNICSDSIWCLNTCCLSARYVMKRGWTGCRWSREDMLVSELGLPPIVFLRDWPCPSVDIYFLYRFTQTLYFNQSG